MENFTFSISIWGYNFTLLVDYLGNIYIKISDVIPIRICDMRYEICGGWSGGQ